MTQVLTRSWLPPLDDDNAVELLHRMVAIPSPSERESELAAYLADAMRQLGYDVSRDAAGNVIGTIGPPSVPEIMLLGHLDTCEGDLPVVLDAERLTGRGTVDAKSPLAAMVIAGARAFAVSPDRCRVTVIGVVEEETCGSKGAVEIRRTRQAPAALVVGEPSGWSSLVVGYKGKLDIRVRATVAATHPTAPVDKATELVAGAWQAFLDLLGDTSHLAFDKPGPTLTWIRGDLVDCAGEFSVRIPPGFDRDAFVTTLRLAAPEVTVTVVGCSVAAVVSDPTDVVCRALRTSVRVQGGKLALKKKTATSDMNVLAEQWDVPMVTYGPGDSRLDHADDEHITLHEFLSGIDVLTGAVGAMAEEFATPDGRPTP